MISTEAREGNEGSQEVSAATPHPGPLLDRGGEGGSAVGDFHNLNEVAALAPAGAWCHPNRGAIPLGLVEGVALGSFLSPFFVIFVAFCEKSADSSPRPRLATFHVGGEGKARHARPTRPPPYVGGYQQSAVSRRRLRAVNSNHK